MRRSAATVDTTAGKEGGWPDDDDVDVRLGRGGSADVSVE
jgi:hypothetical protein